MSQYYPDIWGTFAAQISIRFAIIVYWATHRSGSSGERTNGIARRAGSRASGTRGHAPPALKRDGGSFHGWTRPPRTPDPKRCNMFSTVSSTI
eukprot:4049664-Prymnesium_polylepis.1